MNIYRKAMLILGSCLVVLALVLSGCGAKAYAPTARPETAADSAAAEMAPAAPPETPAASEDMGGGSIVAGGTADPSQKIIYHAYLQVETTQFDETTAQVEQLLERFDGFLERAEVDGHTGYRPDGTTQVVDRVASYVLRVPSAQYSAALKQVGTLGNVISTRQSTDNITAQYIDHEARRDSLKVQEERLLSMLEAVTDVESLVALESRLSEVRYEVEAIERQLRSWQTAVDYSTIEISLREVALYTPTAAVQRSFGQKLADAFADGMRSFAHVMQGLAIGLVGGLPVLVLLAAAGIAAWVVVRRIVRKRRAKALREKEASE